MADVFSKEKRSEIMSSIRSKNTEIEKIAFRFLRKNKIHFQQHYAKVAGKPDIALPSKKRAVFINGDFWHGYRFNFWNKRIPKKYWLKKIEGNILRDKKNYRKLKREGWKVMKIWEHEIKKEPEAACNRMRIFLEKGAIKKQKNINK